MCLLRLLTECVTTAADAIKNTDTLAVKGKCSIFNVIIYFDCFINDMSDTVRFMCVNYMTGTIDPTVGTSTNAEATQ